MTLAFAFIAVQCADKNEKENAGKKVAVAEKKEAVLPNYRYVDGDSVLAAYILAKDYNEEMLRMQTNFDNTARQRENAIQAEMNKMQQKMQNNGYLTEESYKSDEQKLVKNLILGKYFERSFWCVSVVGEISHSFISHTGFFSQPCVLCAVLPQHSDSIMAVSHPTRTPARTAC